MLTAGGTGGHLFPAQSLAEALPDWEILFIAGGLASNPYFDRSRFSFEEIPSATFSLKNPLQIVKGSVKIMEGILQSRRLLKKFDPDLVVGFGSFYTLPLLAAALSLKKPIVLHEQNAVPGKVNRLFAPFAHRVTITFPTTREYLSGKAGREAVEVLFPRRKRVGGSEDPWSYFGLQKGLPTILVFGGSQGAVRLNELFLEALKSLPAIQVLHFAGNEERAAQVQKQYDTLNHPACVKPFEPRMDLAMQIADIAVTRAGAATVCELIDHALPALLIPYPFAAENHQEMNATHFVSHVNGGKMYKEKELDASLLAKTIVELLAARDQKKRMILNYKEQQKAPQLADFIKEMNS